MWRKLFFLMSFVLVLALAGNASADPNLVAYYTLDGDANDTGNVSPAADGDPCGNPIWTTGRVGLGGSIDLDGTGDFVQIPNANKLDITDNLTVAFWLRVDDFGSQWQAIVIKGIAWNDNVWKFEQSDSNPGGILWRLGGEGPSGVGITGSADVNDGQWHHVAGTYERATGSLILYIDGVQDGSASGTPGVAIPTNDLDLYISLVKDGFYIDGGFDDLRIYNRVLSAPEIWDLYNIPELMAHFPDPNTGTVGVASDANLGWTAGDYAPDGHDVYFGTDYDDVNDATTGNPLGVFKGNQSATSYDPPGDLGMDQTYYWRIDEVNSTTKYKGWVWNFAVASYYPTNPGPADGYQYAALDANLIWTAGYGAITHRVFFGTVPNPPPVAFVDMPNTSYNPPGDLTAGVTYNWRIVAYDYYPFGHPLYVSGSGSNYIGPVWSFRATNQLRGWWKFDDGVGDTPADSSGNNNYAVFGVSPNSMPTWTTDGRIGEALEFDGDEDWVEVTHDPNFDITKSMTVTVWIKINDFGGAYQSILGKYDNWKFERAGTDGLGGTILWVIEGGAPWTTYGTISIDDGEWHHLAGVYDGTTGRQYLYVDGVEDEMTDGSGTPHDIPTSINELYIGSNGLACVIDDLRVYDYDLSPAEIEALANVPWLIAHNANPTNKSTAARNLDGMVTLSWIAGDYANTHDVYFGADFNDVNDANTSTPVIYKGNQILGDEDYVAGPLETKTTYYWRIDEVNIPHPNDPWRGDVWSFTTAEYIFVDDFEDYNNTSNKIQDTWIKGGGGNVGYSDPNYAEITIVYGGEQSMPFDYNNVESPYDSNAARTFTSWQDWTAEGVKSLELWVRGWPVYVGSFTGSDPYTITASGTDIGDVPDLRETGYQDEFHYAYKKLTGTPSDYATIIAKVESVSNTDPWAKAGVMIRQSLDPDSENGLMFITPEMGAAFQYRDTAGGLTTTYGSEDDPCMADVTAPYWVKLDIWPPGYLWAYYSDNGSVWTSIPDGPELVALPIYVGLAVTSHNTAATCTAEFSNVSITAPGMTISSWSNQDIGIKSNTAAPLYVTLQDDGSVGGDTATVTHTDPNIVLQTTWQAWDIALNDFEVINPSLNLEKIKKITLGVGPADPCGTGTLYFDDIRLYPPKCVPEYALADFTGDCVVGYEDLGIMRAEWLESDYDVNAVAPSDANLVALYEFATDANFNDTSGNGYDGDPYGNAAIVYDAVIDSNVLSLDGDGDYVVITGSNTPGSAFDINDVITVACWIKVDEFDVAWQAIVTKGDDSWRLARANAIGGSAGLGESVEFACSGLSPVSWATGDEKMDDGQWHHVAGVYDGSRLCIYVDGILDFFENTSGSINNSTYNVLIGANEQEAGREWNGQIDELRIYNRALSHGEIVSLAGESQVTQPLFRPEIDLNEDGKVNLKDYAVLGDSWLEEILWP